MNEDVKEWEEARCPICLETPHNAVLLKCCSHEIGCRPYMCNTSYRHSNCLDQFCKSYGYDPHLSSSILEEFEPHLVCPFCRGEIYGYMVLEPARRYMNSKTRTCSSETCEFQGTYSELRQHARSQHPSARPSEVDPTRRRDWLRMEQETDSADFLSSTQMGVSDMMSMFWNDVVSAICVVIGELRDSGDETRSRTSHRLRVWGDTRTRQSASARWRTNLSSSLHDHDHDQEEANGRARWRTSSSSLASRMPHHYYRYRRNIYSSSGFGIARNPSGHRLRWRDHSHSYRWSMYNAHLSTASNSNSAS